MNSSPTYDDSSALQFRQSDRHLLRAYFAMPGDSDRDRLCKALSEEGVDRSRIHFSDDIHDQLIGIMYANVWQRCGLLKRSLKGAVLGAVAGCVAGRMTVWFPIANQDAGGVDDLAYLCVAGALMGTAFILLASGGENYRRLEAQFAAINRGDSLLMLDINKSRLGRFRRRVKNNHGGEWLGAVRWARQRAGSKTLIAAPVKHGRPERGGQKSS